MKKGFKDECIMDRFVGGLIVYIADYFSSKSSKIYTPTVNYLIPNDKFLAEHWGEVCSELRSLKPLHEYSEDVRNVAIQYREVFFREYPDYKDAECLLIDAP